MSLGCDSSFNGQPPVEQKAVGGKQSEKEAELRAEQERVAKQAAVRGVLATIRESLDISGMCEPQVSSSG
jgi:hypothetical protein